MRSTTLIAALFVAGGCLPVYQTTPADERPAVNEERLRQVFGDVPIIRLGMSENEVDQLVGIGRPLPSIGSIINFDSLYNCGLYIHESSFNVQNCSWMSENRIGPGQKATIDDAKLGTLLQSGLTPRQVEENIGRASCGYCNNRGEVTLLYEQPGIAVDFVDGRLLRWHRVIRYKDEPVP